MRLGVAVPERKLFRSTVVIVVVGKASALQILQLCHHALKPRGATALAVDDSDTTAPVFFFDAPFADVPVLTPAGELGMAATFFGMKSVGSPHLPALLGQAHAVLVVSDPSEDPSIAAKTLAARVAPERRAEVYAARVGSSADALDALEGLVEDIAQKARTPAP